MRARIGRRPLGSRRSGGQHLQARPVPWYVVFFRVFVWGHIMGVAIYLAHGAIWLVAAAFIRLTQHGELQPWITLRLGDGLVLGMWVLFIIALCMLLAGYRHQLGLDD